MNIPDLQKKVAEVLGVSSSQKELAFEIFIDTVASILTEGITLKTPKIGFFQLKNGAIKDAENKSLIFSALPEDFNRDDKNLYLTIDVLQKTRTTSEYDSNVFSIGVGKPLIPLTSDETPDSETSYAMLRKSIEERVKELISESDQIPNFNVWEDYYKENSDPGKQFHDFTPKLQKLSNSLDFTLPGIGRSNASKSPENKNILNSLIVDIPDFNQNLKDHEEKPFNNFDDTKEFVIINDSKPLSNEITIDDLLDENDVNNNFGKGEYIEFEIPESDLSKILIEEPLVVQPKSEIIKDDSTGETISLNKYLINSDLSERTIDLNEYLNHKLNNDIEKQISLKDLGLDRDSLEKLNLSQEEKIELSFNDQVYNRSDDDSGKRQDVNNNYNFEADNVNNNEIIQNDVNGKSDYNDNNEHIENSMFDFNFEFIEKNEPIEDPFEGLIASSMKVNEFGTKQFDNHELENNVENNDDVNLSGNLKLNNNEDVDSFESELSLAELLNIKTKSIDNLKSKGSVSADHTTSDDITEGTGLKPADRFEIIDWPDAMEIKNSERIEWNWGDELKEEFGLGRNESEDITFEEVDDLIGNNDSLITENDLEEHENLKKDLFSRLEKTLENEVTSLHELKDDISAPEIQKQNSSNENQKDKLTNQENNTGNKSTSDITIKNDEKVFLEFQGPPTKFQFVEDKSPLNGKKMAITLSPEFFDELRHEPVQKITREKSTDTKTLLITNIKETLDKELEHDSDSRLIRYSYVKTFSIIISTLVLVGIVIAFFLLRNNSSNNQTLNNKSVQQGEVKNSSPVVPQTSNIVQEPQNQATSKTSSNLTLDESSDFPESATPPVPIKDQATDLPSSSITKNEGQTAVNKSSTGSKTLPIKVDKIPENNGLYRTLSTDTKINSTIYYDGKSYNFQTSSWREKQKAEIEVKRLRALGMTAFIVEAYLPQKGGKWFRVRVGSFNSEKQAEEYKSKNNL